MRTLAFARAGQEKRALPFHTLEALLCLGLLALLSACDSGARVRSDGQFGCGAGVFWRDGPGFEVKGKVPSIDVEANAGTEPNAIPFAPGSPERPVSPCANGRCELRPPAPMPLPEGAYGPELPPGGMESVR